MDLFLIKRRLRAGLWVLGLLVVACMLAGMRFAHNVQAGDGAQYALAKTVTIIGAIAWLLILLAYLFARQLFKGQPDYISEVSRRVAEGEPQPVGKRSVKWPRYLRGAVSIGVLVVVIVALGATIRCLNARKPSPFAVVEQGTVDQLAALISVDSAALHKKQKGATLLMTGAQLGRRDMVEKLLALGAKVHATDRSGRTALFHAMGDPDIVELLLQHGAKVNHADGAGILPLHVAIERRCTSGVRLLIERGAFINARGKELQTPLFMAVEQRFDVVELLLCHGADPELVDQVGETPLHCAARIGNLKAAQALILAGANTSVTSLQGWTPLHLAAMHGSAGVVAALLKAGVAVDIANDRLQTPMSCAVQKSNLLVVDYLLEHGADINRVDGRGNTYLHNAVLNEDYDLGARLIEAGASVDIENQAGISARKLISVRRQDSMLKAGKQVSSL